jgi:hypothetical protein
MTDAEKRAVNRGSVVALLHCGVDAPTVATLAELDEAADRAAPKSIGPSLRGSAGAGASIRARSTLRSVRVARTSDMASP